MPLVNSLLNRINSSRLRSIDYFRRHPQEVQEQTLFNLLSRAKNTEYGQLNGFSRFKSIADFQQGLPVMEYEDFKPHIDRMRSGEENLLWPGKISWFAKSSGTTQNKSKFIPVSREGLNGCHFRGSRDVIAIYFDLYPKNGLFRGKGLTLGGSHQVDTLSGSSRYGDLSAILLQNQPWWTDFIRTPSQRVALIPDWEQKLEKITGETLAQNVTSITGVPSWNLVMIKHILNHTGKSNLLEVWPNLELFIHGGVSFTPYRDQYFKLIPSPQMHYLEAYNASEGFFAIQDNPETDDMLLMLDYGVFYEFIPAEQLGQPNPPAYPIGEVEVGKNYAMLITTSSGLWRYLIGDTVTFTSKSPYKIKITGRTRHFINAFGEEIIIDNAEKAIKKACDATGAQVAEYTAAPVYMETDKKGSHEWLIEFNVDPASLDEFSRLLDAALCEVNSDYEAKRYKNITLDFPLVRSLAKGTFFEWMKRNNKLGGQNKVPRLSNNRDYANQLLAIHRELSSAS